MKKSDFKTLLILILPMLLFGIGGIYVTYQQEKYINVLEDSIEYQTSVSDSLRRENREVMSLFNLAVKNLVEKYREGE